MSDNIKVWEEILSDLQGTCKALYEVLEWHGYAESDMPMDFYYYVDRELFMCDVCGWWCELSEESEEAPGRCNDCERD